MEKIKIAPSILSADFSKMGEEVEKLAGYGADLIHCDVMDGVFVDNITFGPKMIEDIREKTNLELDVHLMIKRPFEFIDIFAEAGADYITVHEEVVRENREQALLKIKKAGKKCGIVINPDTPVKNIEGVIDKCDIVLVMSVFPGFGGQKFIEAVLPKIEYIAERKVREGLKTEIEIDGGINEETAKRAISAGANILVAGSSVFKASDRSRAIKALRGE